MLEADSLSDALAPPGRRVVRPGDPRSARRRARWTRRTAAAARDPLAASRELRPFSDLVLISDGDPVRGRPGLRARGRGRAAAAAARGRRAPARAHQAAGRVPARAHPRPAGPERLRRHQGRAAPPSTRRWPPRSTSWRATRGAIRRSSCWATPSWRGPPARTADEPSPDAAVVDVGRPTAIDAAARRGAAARCPARRWSSVDAAAVDRAAGHRHLRRRARLPAPRRARSAGAHRGLDGRAPPRRVGRRADRRGAGPPRRADRRRAHARRRRRRTTSTRA